MAHKEYAPLKKIVIMYFVGQYVDFCSFAVEDQISKLSSMFQSATTATLTGSCDDGTSLLSETSSLPCRISIPYSYSETEFVSNDDVRVTVSFYITGKKMWNFLLNYCTALFLQERLTAFNKPKCYQVKDSIS